MPGNASAERKALVVAYGAEIVYSDPLEGSDGAILRVRELVAEHPDRYFYPDQYSNPANVRAHYEGTGVEILQQTGGRLTHFVAGPRATATLFRPSRRLKDPHTPLPSIARQPEDSFHGLAGLRTTPPPTAPEIRGPNR